MRRTYLSLLLAATSVLVGTPAVAAPPGNDGYADAQVVSGDVVNQSGANVEATSEPGEPVHSGVGDGLSVWFRWQAPVTTPASAVACYATFDAAVAVYTENGPVPPFSNLASVGGYGNGCNYAAGNSVPFTAEAGTTYLIAVDGGTSAGPNSGSFLLVLGGLVCPVSKGALATSPRGYCSGPLVKKKPPCKRAKAKRKQGKLAAIKKCKRKRRK